MKSYTLSGPSLQLVINNRTFGIAINLTYAISYGKRTLRGIDNPFPQEIVSGQQTVTGNISCIRVRGKSLESYGIVNEQTDASGKIISGILNEPYISISVIDRRTGYVVFQAEKVSVFVQNWAVNTKGLMQGNFHFEGILQVGAQI